MDRKRRSGYPEFVIIAASAAFCMQYTLLYLFSVVLLYVYARRNGARKGSVATLTALGLFILLVGFRALQHGVNREDLLIVTIGMSFPVMLGVFLFVIMTVNGLDRTGRILVGMIPVLMTGSLLTVIYSGEGSAAVSARSFFGLVLESLVEVLDGAMDGNTAEAVAWLFSITERIMMSTYVPSVVAVAGLGVYIADRIPSRLILADRPEAIDETVQGSHDILKDFCLPDRLIWVCIVSCSVLLIDLKFDIGILGAIGWNIGLTTLLLYGVVGVSIISHLSAKRGKSISPSRLLFLCLLLLLVPGANLLISVIIPIIGISEIWIKFRAESKESPNEIDT